MKMQQIVDRIRFPNPSYSKQIAFRTYQRSLFREFKNRYNYCTSKVRLTRYNDTYIINSISNGNPIEPMEEHRPICVDADTLPVCDDVGGIYGYCNMLEVLHGEDLEEKESMKEWAKGMGWTGRKINPPNIL